MIERSYHISDVVQEDFLRFPLSLLANPRYLSLIHIYLIYITCVAAPYLHSGHGVEPGIGTGRLHGGRALLDSFRQR